LGAWRRLELPGLQAFRRQCSLNFAAGTRVNPSEPEPAGQGALGHPTDELAVDLRARGMMADGATLMHGKDGFRFSENW
jgi:hypothetical protein